jgi:hypothetical protein
MRANIEFLQSGWKFFPVCGPTLFTAPCILAGRTIGTTLAFAVLYQICITPVASMSGSGRRRGRYVPIKRN